MQQVNGKMRETAKETVHTTGYFSPKAEDLTVNRQAHEEELIAATSIK